MSDTSGAERDCTVVNGCGFCRDDDDLPPLDRRDYRAAAAVAVETVVLLVILVGLFALPIWWAAR